MEAENVAHTTSFKFADPNAAYKAARRRIVNNALRRQQSRLDLSNFGLVELPPELGRLKSLSFLDISNNQLMKLPPELGDATALQTLRADRNKLVTLPNSLGQLRDLVHLNLNNNKLRELPKSISNLLSLRYLTLTNNNLTAVPAEIGAINSLLTLNLDQNELTFLPTEFGRLANLVTLSIEHNQVTHLPDSFALLSNLEEADLDSNELASLPFDFYRLAKLRRLYLNDNKFSEFPSPILRLPALTILMMSDNKVSSIPAVISQVARLNSIYMPRNIISALPPEIAKLKLVKLNLAGNNLATLPNELGAVVSLEEGAKKNSRFNGLWLSGNPLPDPYPTLIEADQPKATENVLSWLRGELDPSTLSPQQKEEKTLAPPDVPPEPSEEAGPTFRVEAGQIDLASEPEQATDFDRVTQEALHRRLKRQVELLREATAKVGNQHPQLSAVVEEYARLVAPPISQLGVVDLWAAGNAIMAQAIAFEKHDHLRTLTEPLEPNHLSLLIEVSALHGGFILGFPTAANLVSRADRSRLGPEVAQAIGASTSNVLGALSRQRRLFSDRARQLVEALDSALLSGSWDAARIGYTSYATVRNALVALGRISIWINDKGGSLAGGVVIGSVITAANLPVDTLQLIMLFLKSNSADILSFAAPFPELLAYFRWIIDYFDKIERPSADGKSRQA